MRQDEVVEVQREVMRCRPGSVDSVHAGEMRCRREC